MQLSRDADLVLIQEARLEDNLPELVEENYCCTFAPGFARQDHNTGVLTMSRARTINPSLHQHREPWTRLPKAAVVTEPLNVMIRRAFDHGVSVPESVRDACGDAVVALEAVLAYLGEPDGDPPDTSELEQRLRDKGFDKGTPNKLRGFLKKYDSSRAADRARHLLRISEG